MEVYHRRNSSASKAALRLEIAGRLGSKCDDNGAVSFPIGKIPETFALEIAEKRCMANHQVRRLAPRKYS